RGLRRGAHGAAQRRPHRRVRGRGGRRARARSRPLEPVRDGRSPRWVRGTVFTVTSLAERLGHPPDARLLIINCDDLGSSHAANVGVYEALRAGIATSASLMVPCPWAREAAARYRGEDVGVHLTLNAEAGLYRGGPITHAHPLAAEEGILFPDHFVHLTGVGSRRAIERALGDLRPGVTELYVHPAADTGELRALAPDWPARVDDHDLVVSDDTLRSLTHRVGATLIGYRALRDL